MPPSNLAGLSLRDLEYAVAVADLRHFGRAAERCGVSQAGLSEQVRKLEALLGVTLFERTTRRITVTPEGEMLLRQAREVLGAARVLLEMARSRGDPLAAPLRLGVIATLGPYYLPGLLRDLRGRFPQLELRLQEGRTVILLRALLAGELDAVLLALPARAEGITEAPLFFEPFRAVLPADHALSACPRLGLHDLAGEGLLLLEEGHCLRDQALALCGIARIGQERRFASSLEMLRHMIAAGEGYSLLPLLAVPGGVEDDGLVRIRDVAGEAVGRSIGLAWRATDPRTPAFQELACFLRGVAPAGTTAMAPAAPAGRGRLSASRAG
ncbi:Hydrogen peroxide-inducible genes activator [Rhodovastum atsumiense]|uniref:LysR family transcriptional regulator n=1 Tax=Rhodovastum atsumiense TaxID=504468 RepID=A0A5M6J260_9PROT|nr:LysR substrate-binding domain-containing protein [Rhodovastum atsumiense]KAA5614584.1 LysR family transcriptional regulator [Rhodovastum atsumiense]CAH2599921.1 Hydrogen peroxide-inducible genes activator [Rhodovastum atsumiense]